MRIALVVLLSVAFLIEIALGAGILLAPEALMEVFHIQAMSLDILYLATIVGWFCLVVAAFAALAAIWIHKGREEGRILAVLLGIFWIGIGLHLAVVFQRPQHFVLDAAKGAAILLLAILCKNKMGVRARQ